MKLRFTRLHIISGVIILTLLLMSGVIFSIFSFGHFQKQSVKTTPVAASIATVYPMNDVPTPSVSRTQYSNTKYGYTFIYPSQWKLRVYTFQGVDTVQVRYQVEDGDGYPLDVHCATDANGLDAQNWSKQNVLGTGIGYITLKSGETAYYAVGNGQVGYQAYTLVHNSLACTLAEYASNQENTLLANDIVNSFTWQ